MIERAAFLATQKFVDRKWLADNFYRQDEDFIYYRPCPICGQENHSLIERRLTKGRAPVVTCPFAVKFLMVREPDVVGIIEKEEKEFMELLQRFDAKIESGRIPEKLTPEEAFRLRAEEGFPREILETRVDDLESLDRLFEEHRKKSGNVFRKEIFG
jgi:hypothetical protein